MAGAERDRREITIRSFIQQIFTAMLPNQTYQLCGEQDRAMVTWRKAQCPHPPTSASVWGRSLRGEAIGAGLRRKSHFFRQN